MLTPPCARTCRGSVTTQHRHGPRPGIDNAGPFVLDLQYVMQPRGPSNSPHASVRHTADLTLWWNTKRHTKTCKYSRGLMSNMYIQESLKAMRIADEIAKSSEHGLPHFLDPCEIFHPLLKRGRWISRTADDTATAPAMNHGPHLFGPACPPAAVRAGTDGIERDVNDSFFLS